MFRNGKECRLVFFVPIFKKIFQLSHGKHRKENNCLNCGATLQGHFCHQCGQENLEPKESFWQMFAHFFYDITHFDSSFFHTVHHLLWKPGFLSLEYMAGKRASYLHPVRMYVFSSAIFFLLFFTFFSDGGHVRSTMDRPLSKPERQAWIAKNEKQLLQDSTNHEMVALLGKMKDTNTVVTERDVYLTDEKEGFISYGNKIYHSAEEYKADQAKLPSAERDGWFMRRLVSKIIEINNRYREDPDGLMGELGHSILHRLPYMLLISLPLFAGLLKLIYIRRKQFYYADHGVFTIHLYVFTFVILTLIFILAELSKLRGFGFIGFVIAGLVIAMAFYLYRAMKTFYAQGWVKTFFKWLILVITSLIMMLLLLIIIMFFSAVTL